MGHLALLIRLRSFGGSAPGQENPANFPDLPRDISGKKKDAGGGV